VAWPVPTLPELAGYTGRPEVSYTSYVNSALLQATIMFTALSELSTNDYNTVGSNTGMPLADAQQLANAGVMAMADYLYLRWPYQQVLASPLQNETIGSYSYSKPVAEMARNAQAIEVTAEKTGVDMFDLAVRMLANRTRANGVFYGQISGFEIFARDESARIKYNKRHDRWELIGPEDTDQVDMQFFDVNAQAFPQDPGV
jgi:hypothetical protein